MSGSSLRHAGVGEYGEFGEASTQESHTSCNYIYLHAGQVAPTNIAEHGQRNYGKQVYNKTYAVPCSSV